MTVVDELEKHDQLKSCDGIAYISSLTDGLPRLKSIDSYIRIVKDKARLRELIRTCHGVASRALDGSEEPDQLIADAQSRFLKLTDGSGTKTAVATREIAERYPGVVSALLDPSKGEKGLINSVRSIRSNDLRSSSGGVDHHRRSAIDGEDCAGAEHRRVRD